jgi:hypothetical protein
MMIDLDRILYPEPVAAGMESVRAHVPHQVLPVRQRTHHTHRQSSAEADRSTKLKTARQSATNTLPGLTDSP